MTWWQLAWYPPLLFGIACVLGATGTHPGRDQLVRSILRTFVWLFIGITGVGVAIHLIATLFSG